MCNTFHVHELALMEMCDMGTSPYRSFSDNVIVGVGGDDIAHCLSSYRIIGRHFGHRKCLKHRVLYTVFLSSSAAKERLARTVQQRAQHLLLNNTCCYNLLYTLFLSSTTCCQREVSTDGTTVSSTLAPWQYMLLQPTLHCVPFQHHMLPKRG